VILPGHDLPPLFKKNKKSPLPGLEESFMKGGGKKGARVPSIIKNKNYLI